MKLYHLAERSKVNTEVLSEQLGVARNTVMLAYQQLVDKTS